MGKWIVSLFVALLCGTALADDAQATGRIEGVYYEGGKPAADIKITALSAAPENRNLTATTDESGAFRIDGVEPGKYLVLRNTAFPHDGGHVILASHTAQVFVEPGTAATVSLGKTGRTLRGRFVQPGDGGPDIVWQAGYRQLTRHVPGMKLQMPGDLTEEERAERWEAFVQTDAYRAAASTFVAYTPYLADDGSFYVEGVIPGDYSLRIDVHTTDDPETRAGVFMPTITVPEGDDLSVYDIGDITVDRPAKIDVGDMAPRFQIESVTGGAVGNEGPHDFLLLDFWATWCPPCREDTPELIALRDTYGASGQFNILSLSLDDSPDAPAAYAKAHGLTWPQGFLGNWDRSVVRLDFNVTSIPTYILLNPLGRVVVRSNDIEDVRAYLADELKP